MKQLDHFTGFKTIVARRLTNKKLAKLLRHLFKRDNIIDEDDLEYTIQEYAEYNQLSYDDIRALRAQVNTDMKRGKTNMIIDIIIERRDDVFEYTETEALRIYQYAEHFEMAELSGALDHGTNKDVQRELCNYIDNNGYRPELKDYINSVNWLPEE